MPINANNSELIEIIATVHHPFVSSVQQQNLHKNAIESDLANYASNVVYSFGTTMYHCIEYNLFSGQEQSQMVNFQIKVGSY